MRTTCGRSGEVTDYIASLEPDIVGLVESDGGSFRNGGISHPEALAERMGQQCIFSPKYRHSRLAERVPVLRHQGNAVVTGLPILETCVHRLRRGIKNAVIEAAFPDFIFLLVHLSVGPGARRRQILELAEIAGGRSKPVLLAGDFNTFGGERELEPLLLAGLEKAGPVCFPTFPSGRPRLGLDMILHSPEVSVTSFSVPAENFSDHLPVVCDFTLDKLQGGGGVRQ
jgi:endonuclease/exonuclease/phosphatase family metal-dependent hydrolase